MTNDVNEQSLNNSTSVEGQVPDADSYFDYNSGEQASDSIDQVPEQSVQLPPVGTVEETKPNDNDLVRLKYYQSEYDKARIENEKLKQIQEQVNPLLEFIGSDEELKQTIINRFKEKQNNVAKPPVYNTHQVPMSSVRENQELLKVLEQEPPTPPVKPSYFNDYDALNEPESDSAKYMKDFNSYLTNIADYNYKFGKALKYEQTMIREQKAQEAEARYLLSQTENVLTSQFGLSSQEVPEFISEMSRPESITLENLVGLWKMKKNKSTNPSTGKPNSFLPPVSVAGTQGNPVKPSLRGMSQEDIDFNTMFFGK